jgi:hypothetical protein
VFLFLSHACRVTLIRTLERSQQVWQDQQSIFNPDVFMSVTMDAKAPIPLPSFIRLPKGCIRALRVPYNVYGMINSGLGLFEYTTHFDHWPLHDANIAISYLWEHLRRVIEKDTPRHTLFLAADNCARDNKNKWMFTFLAVLVHFGIFDTIEYHFLPPGHSHEKVRVLNLFHGGRVTLLSILG